jgi:hypothetical protein
LKLGETTTIIAAADFVATDPVAPSGPAAPAHSDSLTADESLGLIGQAVDIPLNPESPGDTGQGNVQSEPTAVESSASNHVQAIWAVQPTDDLQPPAETSLALPPRAIPRGMRGSLFIALVFIPLVSYAILATIAVAILYTRPPPPDPLERLPDLEGDFKGTQHKKQGKFSYQRVSPESDLPAYLQVPLGTTIRIGDVELKAQSVELCRLTFRRQGVDPENSGSNSLVMHLLFRNASSDSVFSPTDPYFDRLWRSSATIGKPYTFLEIDQQRFFGGAVAWQPGQSAEERETIDGQNYKLLRPGEELTTMVCTDPEARIEQSLSRCDGPLLWRIQVRRGLVTVAEREISATAVVGVLFAVADVQYRDLKLGIRP